MSTVTARPTTPAAQRGTTTIADAVVLTVAGGAVRGVPGVHPARGPSTRGVSVSVEEGSAAVSVELVADLGASLPAVAEAVRRSVAEAVQALTGLRVRSVDVHVADVVAASQDAGDGAAGAEHPPRTRTTAR